MDKEQQARERMEQDWKLRQQFVEMTSTMMCLAANSGMSPMEEPALVREIRENLIALGVLAVWNRS